MCGGNDSRIAAVGSETLLDVGAPLQDILYAHTSLIRALKRMLCHKFIHFAFIFGFLLVFSDVPANKVNQNDGVVFKYTPNKSVLYWCNKKTYWLIE